jgi:hypothetical protein
MSTISSKSSDEINMADGANGVFQITRHGLYQFEGAACVSENPGYQLIALQINGAPDPNQLRWLRYFTANKSTGVTTQPSLPFAFTAMVTDADIIAGANGKAGIFKILLFTSESCLLNNLGIATWLTIARVG